MPSTDMGHVAQEWSTAAVHAGRYGLRAEDVPRGMPPEPAGAACVFLASGQADALSGRHIGAWQDLAELVRRAEEIGEQDLHALRLRI